MKTRRKYVVLAFFVVVIITIAYAYSEYTRKPADLSELKSQAGISADSLVILFDSDEIKANALYLGKPIDVTGTIAEIANQHDTIVNVILGEKDAMHRVSCLLDVYHINDIKPYKVGQTIILRGICNGYLMDVELNRCVVIHN